MRQTASDLTKEALMLDQDRAITDAREAAGPTPGDELLERLADAIGAKEASRPCSEKPSVARQ